MKKIVVAQNLSLYPDQKQRLEKLGETTFYDSLATDPEDWLSRVKNADIICTGKFGLRDKIYELKNVFISLPFVGISFLDKEKLASKNITVAYCPGCNKTAVSEWIIGMLINLFRQLPEVININHQFAPDQPLKRTLGLAGKKICILGQGNIGSYVGNVCQALNMQVSYFKRGSDLFNESKDADVIINALSLNPTTENFLDEKFFNSLKQGAFYISVTFDKIHNLEAMFSALDKNILAGVAIDAGGIQTGNVLNPIYQRLIAHPKVYATPHVAYKTDVASRVSYDMMIDNIEAWLKGKPINIVK